MKKEIVIKIIGSAIIFTFAMFFWQAVTPITASAATGGGLNWDNPNKSGNNPYKFKPQDVLNSQTIMQVVGCTGVVDKISGAIVKLFQKKLKAKIDDQMFNAVSKICQSEKGATEMGAAIADEVGTQITAALKDVLTCDNIQKSKDAASFNAMLEKNQQDESARRTTECFNGIAISLAKNQLTAMTRYTVNWINTGFNGNPMYVQNITSLTSGIERGVVETGYNTLMDPNNAYPYGRDFSMSMINNYTAGSALRSGATNFLGTLTSDLGAFVTDPVSYLPDSTLTALQRAQRANDAFSNDFATGGWDGWLALTQRDQNNPLGFAMQVSQYEADQQAAQLQGTKEELAQNNGFLSQKKCVKYSQPAAKDAAAKYGIPNLSGKTSTSTASKYGIPSLTGTTPTNTAANYGLENLSDTPTCIQWDVVTPGSIIKDQLSNFVNSPVRQLELAKTINDSLNAVFSALISKLQSQGLSSLSSDTNTYSSDNLNSGKNVSTSDLLGNRVSPSSGYTDGSFDLTRDLGNIFVHNYTHKSQGNWDANRNLPELNIGVAPLDDRGNPMVNVYYTVSVAGNTKLINEGYNGWAIGDRAFWNGTDWQNWKKGTADPIANRGVIQVQKDYIVAAKELLANLPAIMPKMGKLDYCIPGPNPNWQAISADAYSSFIDYSYSLSSQYKAGSLVKRDSMEYSVAQPGQSAYDNYKKIFEGTNTFSGTLDVKNARESDTTGTGTTPQNVVTKTPLWIYINGLGSSGTLRKSLDQTKIGGMVNDLLVRISNELKDFNTQYGLINESIYGSTGIMQKQFIEREDTSELIPNPGWLPMASEGLNITKDIVSYANDIDQTAQGYKDDIIQANTNISKLNIIKDQVSVIIKAAQKRRDDNLIKILNDEAARNHTPVLTTAQYKAKYASCLDEENIVFYEDTEIFNNNGGQAERCNDGIDNDLNGLVDAKDPACQNLNVTNNGTISAPVYTPPQAEAPTNSIFGCQIDSNIPAKYSTSLATTNCSDRTPENCTNDDYVNGTGQSYQCKLLFQ